MIEIVLYVAVFIFLSGLLALIDAAVLSVSKAEIGAMAAKKKYGSRQLQKISSHMPRAVVVIVIFTNLINVLGPILVGRKAVELFGSTVLGIVTAVLTFGTIILSEIIPKSIGVHYAPLISRLVAPAIYVLTIVFFPVVVVLEAVSRLFQKSKRKVGTEDQITSLVRLGRRAGHIKRDEETIIKRVFMMNDKTAGRVATPIDRVVWFHADEKISSALKKVLRKDFSRYPVFGASVSEIKGYIISRDILDAVTLGKSDRPVSEIARDPLVLSANTTLDSLLRLFKRKRAHIAILQDAGTTAGIVTLEDVLEELVGEIEDEKD